MAFRIAWATDIHFDHLNDDEKGMRGFAANLCKDRPDCVVLAGDISISSALVKHLAFLESCIERPIYFVLGNHDYWNGDIASVRSRMSEISRQSSYLKYLPTMEYAKLAQNIAVVGNDCWYDMYYGDWKKNVSFMNDWVYTRDFVPFLNASNGFVNPQNVNIMGIINKSRQLALDSVMHIRNGIKQAAARGFSEIIVVSHVPPFPDSMIDKQKNVIDEVDGAPFFACKTLGDMLLNASSAYPNVNFIVLTGHTHSACAGRITKNLSVFVGGAEYGKPAAQKPLDFH